MGCGGSKFELEEENPASLRPSRRRFDEMMRRKSSKVRKDSIVSTTELLMVEEPEDEASQEDSVHAPDAQSPPPPDKASPPPEKDSPPPEKDSPLPENASAPSEKDSTPPEESRPSEKTTPAEHVANSGAAAPDGEEEGRRRLGFGKDGKGRKLGHEEEELPGSPSFRVYFVELAPHSSDDDSVNSVKRKDGHEDIEGEDSYQRRSSAKSLNSNEDSGCKSPMKDKGRRFKAIAKGPSAMYSLLNVRSCYNHDNSSAVSRETPHLLSEKAT